MNKQDTIRDLINRANNRLGYDTTAAIIDGYTTPGFLYTSNFADHPDYDALIIELKGWIND